ncbi:MAG TPA: hypothetical protein VFX06_01840 [Stellaceae bacterium]|nr:hypothetical protein [Stellaceae bacterium]
MKFLCLMLALGILAGCSDSGPPAPPENRVKEQQVLLEHCGDQTWKEQNLGLWYSVCRPTMRW